MDNKILVTKLIELNALSQEVGQKLLQEASFSKKPIDEIIYERKITSDEAVLKAKTAILGIPSKSIDQKEISDELIKLVPEATVRNFKVVPISKTDDMLIMGMVNPDDEKAQEALKFLARQVKVNLGVYLISMALWDTVLRRYSPYRSEVEAAVKSLTSYSGKKISIEQKITSLESGGGAEDAPIIRIVASTLKEAVWQKASDIHIEPQRSRLRIRFRIDGELIEVATMPIELYQAIVSRVKVLSNLKLDETRIPQDGRFRTVLMGRDIDFRVATFPTPVGEKVAIRVLDPTVGLKGLEELGLIGKNLKIIKESINKPYGMILITGPTGSGKSTTLYALMQILNKEDINIVSLEDPVEYYMDGLNQSQVHPEIGYDFASGLRQILRQDPDVIMVGEIRDDETADLAINAALTGHLVLSTLHTTEAAGAIPRLIDMKAEPFLISSTLNLIIAQRLVRKIHEDKTPYKLGPAELKNLAKYAKLDRILKILKQEGLAKPTDKMENINFYRAKPSAETPDGYKGRMGIYEVLAVNDEIKAMIVKKAATNRISKLAKQNGMRTMVEDGFVKAAKGLTSIEEILRVITE